MCIRDRKSAVRIRLLKGAAAVKPDRVGSLGNVTNGELSVSGGVTVPEALIDGKTMAGVFGMLPPNWVTSWFISRREKNTPNPLRTVSLRLALYANPKRGAQLL